ncbi:bile acid-coenzyme A ligase [Actinocorallia herbida]|uniref:Bile acid-coenzyme A ligase n=1 Tax=Actinocorallia herbida TaxID=58109 RepID=A0A3N1CV63_9ACTN|nr:AMP-binding protein [Actinocorallia herbida]ROO85193.1 bile acid-coenzyme A ligase [Actinocorallia herbida]
MDEPRSFGAQLADLAARRPDDVVLRFAAPGGAETALTAGGAHRRASQIAVALDARGLRRGDRLSLALRNTPEFVLSVLAAWRLGAVPVPMRWDLPDWELSRVRAVVRAKVHLAAEDAGWLAATAADPVPELRDLVPPQCHGICSSGSTGTPKVILADRPGYFDARRAAPFAAAWGPVPRPETILVPAPMYHTNGFFTLQSLLAGDRLVVLERFDAAQAVDLIERHAVTTFTATPTMLRRLAALPGIEERDLSGLRWILQGAAPLPPALARRWCGLVGPERMFTAYGMTEGFGFTGLRGDEWAGHEGSVGRPVRGTEIRILDDDGEPVPAGEPGLVHLRCTTSGQHRYVGSAPDAPATSDGFATAGDIGYLDEDGYLYLLDRAVDLIVTGGANVYPAEVEHALLDHPGIADVAVIGLRDPEWGRRVHAVIEPAAPLTAADVITYARARLAPYKVPKTVEFVAALPRSAATKLSRTALVAERGG